MLLYLATGCSTDVQRVFVEGPPTGDARSAVLVATFAGQSALEAFDVEAGGNLPVRWFVPSAGEADVARLDVLLFDVPLTELGLVAGALETESLVGVAAGDAAPFLRQLSVTWRLGETAGPWVESLELSSEAAAVRLPAALPRCATWEISVEPLEGAFCRPALMASLDDQRAFVAVEDGTFFEVSRSTRRRLGAINPRPGPIPNPLVTSGFQAGAGHFILAGLSGAMYQVELDAQPPVRRMAATATGSIWWVAGGTTAAGLEMYTLSFHGLAQRLTEDGRAETVGQLPGPAGDDNERLGGVAWLGPKHALFASAASSKILRYRDGQAAFEGIGTDAGLIILEKVPGVGVIAASKDWEIFLEHDGAWTKLPNNGLFNHAWWPKAFGQFSRGFLYSTSRAMHQYVMGRGACTAQAIPQGFVNKFTRLGDDVLGGVHAGCGAPANIRWLRQKTGP